MSNMQLKPIAAGDTVAIIKTTMGDIKFKLFPEKAPKTVENFTTLAKQGYYDGIIFHRVIKDFMIQGGDPTGTGMGGQSIYGHPFEDECCLELRNYRGALSMANAGPNTNGSQFFIVHASEVDDGLMSQMKQLVDRGFPAEVNENYAKLGGTPWLDFKHTVFGQVVEGMDTVDAIANVKTAMGDKPVDEVKIITVEIIEE
ncbi:MAG: peptidylprolyl isomerase [Clostridia bacterium]|nr:peptidylprolyl isomerase [Clostridia bacterium]